jgi:hypothetical protein
MTYPALVLVMCSLFLPFCVHVGLTRFIGLFRQSENRQRAAALSVAAGGVGMVAACWYVFRGTTALWSCAYCMVIYVLSGYSYFHFFNMSETSRRIKLMTTMSAAGSYTTGEMVTHRLSRLRSLGELRFDGATYTRGRGMLLLPAHAVFFLHRLLFGDAVK